MNWSHKIRHVMSAPAVFVDLDAPPSRVAALLETSPFHHLPVLDGGVLVGVVSSIDLARVSLGAWVSDPQTERAWLDTQFRIADLMSWEPQFVREDDSVKLAADKLSTGDLHCLPVLDQRDALTGIVTSTDLLRWLVTA